MRGDFCEKNYNRALYTVREGLKYNILNSDLYYTMGNVYEVQENYNRAYLCYEQALYLCKQEENKEVIKGNITNLKHNYRIEVNKVSIVILTYNQVEYTKACIDSIRKYNEKDTYELIVVDNNSTDGTVIRSEIIGLLKGDTDRAIRVCLWSNSFKDKK